MIRQFNRLSLQEKIDPRLVKIHMDIKKAQLDELDDDLKKVFDGIHHANILEGDMQAVMRLQELRYLRQRTRKNL